MRAIWGRQLSLVPQDPLASLNPSYTIGDQIAGDERVPLEGREIEHQAWEH